MAITSTNFTDISYIVEVTNGVTPATPAFQILPTKGSSLQGNTSTVVSEVIRSDRQIDDLVIVDQDVSGAVDFELSYAPYKPWIESLMQTTAAPQSIAAAVDIGFTITTEVIDSTPSDLSVFNAGDHILISGATNVENNGVFLVLSDGTATSLTLVAGSGLVTEAAAASVTIKSNPLRNGVVAADSYSILKHITGITTPVFMYYRGCQISSMNLNFETGSILGGAFNVVGLTEDVTETAIASQTKVATPAYTLMNSVSSLAISSTGLAAGTSFQTLNLTIDNNINAAKAIGTLGAVDLASFTLNVTADITIYFENKQAYDQYLQSTSFSVTATATDGSGNVIVVYLPYCKFETLESPIPGKDNFFLLNGSLRALRDPTDDFTVQISTLDV